MNYTTETIYKAILLLKHANFIHFGWAGCIHIISVNMLIFYNFAGCCTLNAEMYILAKTLVLMNKRRKHADI